MLRCAHGRHPLYTSEGGGGATLHAFACYEYHEAFCDASPLAINQNGKWGRRNGHVWVDHEGSSIFKIAKLRDKWGRVSQTGGNDESLRLLVCRV
jgi:hypothetical protein